MRTKGKAARMVPKGLGSHACEDDDGIVGSDFSDLVPKTPLEKSSCQRILEEFPVKEDFSYYKRSDLYSDRYLKQNVYSKFDEELGDFYYRNENDDSKSCKNNIRVTHKEVKKILKLYRETLYRLMRENEKSFAKIPNIHHCAAMVLQNSHNFLNVGKRLGSVPGVEIGVEFEVRAELYIVGLHLQFEKGIDYMERNGTTLTTSIVASGRYANFRNSSDVLIYSGEGGNPRVQGRLHLKDQVLKRGNLAMKNSMERKTPVRVIRKGYSQQKTFDKVYIYDGLYLVEKYWRERGQFGKLVFKFQLRRISGQPKLSHGFIGKSNKYSLDQEGLILSDISRGKEKVPIVVVNTINDERPSPFTYVASVKFPSILNEFMSRGCDCDDGCSDSEDCSCKGKNGGVFLYDYNECIVRKMPFIYECGPCCKCFDSCINKLSQRGIRFQLEVFKTKSKGWGVRSKTFIPAGSFICEYVGEILKLKEAKQNSNSDEYWFLMGNNKNGCSFRDLSSFEEEVFIIDATSRGNVGRFINHSCSPNLYVQRVFIGHGSKISRVMLFAMKDIAPFEELTYDYNCRFGDFGCKNLNMAKNCCCGSFSCVRKFY